MWFNRSNRLPAFVFPLTFFLLFVALVLLASTHAPAVHAGSTITVNTTTDEVNPADGTCSLREAVIAANTNAASGGAGECIAGSAGSDTIRVPAGTYTLAIAGTGEDNAATGDLDIREDLAIQGATAATTKIDANGIDRVFDVLNSAHATFSTMTIEGGDLPGLVGLNGAGGGIRVNASTSISTTKTLFIVNHGDWGGGLYVAPGGAATVSNSSFANDSANFGGSIQNEGTLTVTAVSFSWWNPGVAANGGGALYNFGPAKVSDSTFMNFITLNEGGAIETIGPPLQLNRVTIKNNHAGTDGGAIYAAASMTLTNVTLSNNTASGNGGALYMANTANTVTLLHSTVYSNSAASGGGIYRLGPNGTVALESSLLYAGASGGNCSGTVTSQGYNLDGGNTCGLNATGDITDTNPMLGPLANNGGPTETHALLFGSPAIDRIPIGTNGCGTTITMDQRRFSRPMGPGCDMGAYEAVPRLLLPLILK